MVVLPFTSGEIETYLGESIQAGYIVHYLSELGAKTIVVEEGYIVNPVTSDLFTSTVLSKRQGFPKLIKSFLSFFQVGLWL